MEAQALLQALPPAVEAALEGYSEGYHGVRAVLQVDLICPENLFAVLAPPCLAEAFSGDLRDETQLALVKCKRLR